MDKAINRVVFYSKHDMSSSRNLINAEKIILNFDPDNEHDINDIIELYNIKLYFDNGIYLEKWTEDQKDDYSQKVNGFFALVSKYFSTIDNSNILNLFDEIDYQYFEAFWSLINRFKTYENIEAETFKELTKAKRFYIRRLLKNKGLTKHFSSEVKEYLMSSKTAAEVILSYFEEANTRDDSKLYFPELTQADHEIIFDAYLDSPNANLNYVRLIESARNIRLSDSLKLKAKRLSDKLNNEILENGSSWSQGILVSISKDQVEPLVKSFNSEKNALEHCYGEQWLKSSSAPVGVLFNFRNLFGYLSQQGCINLVSKNSEVDVMESIFMRSKNDYFVSAKFQQKNLLSHAQLMIYDHFLNENEIRLEDSLASIVNDYLNEKYDINGLRITFPSSEASSLEKIRTLAPELEFLLKQYNSFIENGFIDFELIQFSSSPSPIGQLKTGVENKYCYGDGDEFLKLRHLFFSNQSMLHYIDRFKSKYDNLYQLLELEDVSYDEFQEYQKPTIDRLVENGYLDIAEGGIVKIKATTTIFIIGVLYKEDVLSFWHYEEDVRTEILRLKEIGIVRLENTLFSEEERKYLNFFLNKKEFENGFDLRNKYLHGTNTHSEKEQKRDYTLLMRIAVLIILKIREDLHLIKEVERATV